MINSTEEQYAQELQLAQDLKEERIEREMDEAHCPQCEMFRKWSGDNKMRCSMHLSKFVGKKMYFDDAIKYVNEKYK